MIGQICLNDIMQVEAHPLFKEGQTVYILELDIVKRVEIGKRNWLCKLGEYYQNQKPYYGYDVKGGVIWDKDLGVTVFVDEGSALEAVARTDYEKYYPSMESLDFTEGVGYQYQRKIDGHRLVAVIAKLGDLRMYERDFMCYSFIRTYPSTTKRDKEYAKLLNKIQNEAQRNNAATLEPIAFESPLYKVGNIYASREYALHHLMAN